MEIESIKIPDAAKSKILDLLLPFLIRNFSSDSENFKQEVVKILATENVRLYQITEILDEGYSGISKMIRENGIEISQRGGKKLPEEKRKKIRELLTTTDLSHNAIKRIVGCSKCAVYWESKRIRKEQAEPEAGELTYRSLVKPKRCAVHGMVTQWPCVACEAETARGQKLGQ